MSLADNLTLTGYRTCAPRGWLRLSAQREQARRWMSGPRHQARTIPTNPCARSRGATSRRSHSARLLHQTPTCCCSTSPRAAWTSAARRRSMSSSRRPRRPGQGDARGQLVSARAVRAVRSARRDEPRPAHRRPGRSRTGRRKASCTQPSTPMRSYHATEESGHRGTELTEVASIEMDIRASALDWRRGEAAGAARERAKTRGRFLGPPLVFVRSRAPLAGRYAAVASRVAAGTSALCSLCLCG